MKINNCPHCKHEAQLMRPGILDGCVKVYCPNCWMCGPKYSEAQKEVAIEKWNNLMMKKDNQG